MIIILILNIDDYEKQQPFLTTCVIISLPDERQSRMVLREANLKYNSSNASILLLLLDLL